MKKDDMKQEFRVHEYYERTGPIKQSSEDAAEAYKKMFVNDRIVYRPQLKKQIIESRYVTDWEIVETMEAKKND